MHPPPANFKNVFDEYNYSLISNLFDKNKPYALSMHNRKYAKKMHYVLAKHSELGSKNFTKIRSKIIQKALKSAITSCKFSKFF